MSYRSVKRVLGETSLERKCRFLFGACLLVLITASFWWYGSHTEKLVYQQNRSTGRLLVARSMLSSTGGWETNNQFRRYDQRIWPRILSKQDYQWRSHPLRTARRDATGREDDAERRVRAATSQGDILPPGTPRTSDGDSGRASISRRYLPDRQRVLRTTGRCMPRVGLGASTCHNALGGTARAAPPPTEGDLMAVVRSPFPTGPRSRRST